MSFDPQAIAPALVSYDLMGISDDEIARVLGLTSEQVVSVRDCVEYQAGYREKKQYQLSKVGGMNEAWDSMEAQALRVVNGHLAMSQNPDFALKAATMANRAQRRGTNGNGTITDVQRQSGTTVVLNLPTVLVAGLNNLANSREQLDAKQVSITVDGEATEIRHDVPAPNDVRKLIGAVEAKEEMKNIIDGLEMELFDDG